MIDINWARENSKEDSYTKEIIKRGMAVLESAIDDAIKLECRKGRQGANVHMNDGHYIHGMPIRDEAIKAVCQKYRNAGYTVNYHSDYCGTEIGIVWNENYCSKKEGE